MAWVRPQTLRALRSRLGLHPEDVEREAKSLARSRYDAFTAADLKAWEQGKATPGLAHLETLSELYGCPVGHFFLDEPPPLPRGLSFRGLAPDKEKQFGAETQKNLRRFLELAEWLVTLIEENGVDWKVELRQQPGVSDLKRVAEEERRRLGCDSQVRATWHSAEQAFDWWRRRIEDAGVFCLQMRLHPKDIRGASVWMKDRYPFVLVNRQDAEAAAGRIFTLLHEYGHLLLGGAGIACDFQGRGRNHQGEPAANLFAARVLLPEDAFTTFAQSQRLRWKPEWSDAELDKLRAPFFVSRDVVAIRLAEMGLAPADFYDRKRARWQQRYAKWRPWGPGQARTKKERRAAELGSSPLRVLLSLRDKGALPVLDSAYALDMKVEKIPEFLDWSRGYVGIHQ